MTIIHCADAVTVKREDVLRRGENHRRDIASTVVVDAHQGVVRAIERTFVLVLENRGGAVAVQDDQERAACGVTTNVGALVEGRGHDGRSDGTRNARKNTEECSDKNDGGQDRANPTKRAT